MKITMLQFVLCAVFLCSGSRVLSGEEIQGAFGIKLGDVFDASKASKTNEYNDYLTFEIKLTNRSSDFHTLTVYVTPTTRKVFRIEALGQSVTDRELAKLQSILREKYDTTEPEEGMRSHGTVVIFQGNRYIGATNIDQDGRRTVFGYAPGVHELRLDYVDRKLEDLASEEAAQRRLDKKFNDRSEL